MARALKPAFGEDDDLLIGPPGQSRWSYACSKLTDEFLALAYARGKITAGHHRAAVQHRRSAPDRTLRHGAARFIAAAKKASR